MRYGFVIPHNDVQTCPALAAEAEAAGWDGIFIPDCIAIDVAGLDAMPAYDPWIVLAAMALQTQRIALGPMLTPPARRRPWKLAQEAVTLDHLSHGRLILSVGLGAAADDAGFYRVGEPMDLKVRAQLLDESLAIVSGLWSGQRLTYQGLHYQVQDMQLLPRPVQVPRIPIWVVGRWPGPKSMQRTLRWDGVLPAKQAGALTPDDIAAIRAFAAQERGAAGAFDIVVEGSTPGDDPARAGAIVRPLAAAGATWWLEAMWSAPNGLEDQRRRIRQGPPRSA
ncbi:MAG TPA: LLM class flavin-dependent oxidoreductase [Chloroflexia bacterium]|nr:LLM class flavin-dependent oxidoreductase [Chloroflexia bacterium]